MFGGRGHPLVSDHWSDFARNRFYLFYEDDLKSLAYRPAKRRGRERDITNAGGIKRLQETDKERGKKRKNTFGW
jgi:hypothetical protein